MLLSLNVLFMINDNTWIAGEFRMDFLGSTGIYTFVFICIVIIGVMVYFAKKVKWAELAGYLGALSSALLIYSGGKSKSSLHTINV